MRFVIVGNGVAGVTAALTIRNRLADASITLLSGEGDYFFSRNALMYAFLDRMSLPELEPYDRKHWERLRIELVRGWVEDLDATTQQLRLSDGRLVGYDRLLIATGSKPKKPDWPGLEKVREGLVNFVSLQDLAECERLIKTSRETVVVGGGLIGVELVECLCHHERQVSFLVKDPHYWPAALGPEEGSMIDEHIRGHGVDLRVNEPIVEVRSDSAGRVSGIVTGSGALVPCQMLGIAIGVEPRVDWLRSVKTPPAIGRGVQVDAAFRTSIDNIFAAGDCAEILRPGEDPFVEQIWYSAKRQGRSAALSMLGDPVDYLPPVFFNSAKFFGIEYTTVGHVNDAPAGATHFYWRHPSLEISTRFIELDGALIGANLLGSRWDHTVFEEWVGERRSLDFVIANLEYAQFDEEFGRLDLTLLREAWQAKAKV
jgi:NADPH-dependent 2,4-dienoyl-CoA reductase/sulfur reductase-like enzyme